MATQQPISKLNPLFAGGDGDGFSALHSASHRLDHLYDQDMDRIGDYWEIRYGLSYTDRTDAGEDQDNDRRTALEEFVADTDPFDPQSAFTVDLFIDLMDQKPNLVFTTSSERLYQIERRPDRAGASWQEEGVRFNGSGARTEREVGDGASGNNYRVRVERP